MTHLELILVLQECPESPFFARDDYNLNENEARRQVLAFVERSNFDSHQPHEEVSPLKEKSQSLSVQNDLQQDGEENDSHVSVKIRELDDNADIEKPPEIDQVLQIEEEIKESPPCAKAKQSGDNDVLPVLSCQHLPLD